MSQNDATIKHAGSFWSCPHRDCRIVRWVGPLVLGGYLALVGLLLLH